MAHVTWDGTASYEMVLDGSCKAPATAVYAVLTDLPSHLEWGGQRQRRSFRLKSLRAGGPAVVGTEFTSAGSIPMTTSQWIDRSVVVAAESPAVLEFHTDSVAVWSTGKQTKARWEHRYDIQADGTGCRVAYRLRRTAMADGPLRMRLPVMRTVTHRVMIPFFCRRGFTNLLRAAENRATSAAAT